MPAPDVKQLEALIKMLRKHGVVEFEGHDLKLRIDPPNEPKNGTADKPSQDPSLTDEDLLLWSSAGYTDGN